MFCVIKRRNVLVNSPLAIEVIFLGVIILTLSNFEKCVILNALYSYLFCIDYLLPYKKGLSEDDYLYYENERLTCISLISFFKS